MIRYKWILCVLLIFAAIRPLRAQSVLELAHVKPDNGKAYVVAELSSIETDSVRVVFSCLPKIKIRDYHKTKVNYHKAKTRSFISCPKYMRVKVIAGHVVLADTLHIGLIRKLIAENKSTGKSNPI